MSKLKTNIKLRDVLVIASPGFNGLRSKAIVLRNRNSERVQRIKFDRAYYEAHRTNVLLESLSGKTITQIAREQNVTRGCVEVRLSKAKRSFRHRMRDVHWRWV